MEFEFYIIKMYLTKSKYVYLIWGQNDFEDILLLDSKKNILGFSTLKLIKQINKIDTEVLLFEKITNYKGLFQNDIAFYSIIEVTNILNKGIIIQNFSKDEYTVLVNFFNLVTDYFYQIKIKKYLSILENKNIKMFFDYYYDKHFWKSTDKKSEIDNGINEFQYNDFYIQFFQLINIFEKKIKIITRFD